MKMKIKIVVLFWGMCFSYCSRSAAQEPYILREAEDAVSVLSPNGTDFGFFMPETGGYLKTGLIVGKKSFWLQDAQMLHIKKQKKGWTVEIKDPILNSGMLTFRVLPLSDSNGLILQVLGEKMPENVSFFWVYGGCSAINNPQEKQKFLEPAQCKDNVFSREINAFTVYFGPNQKLKVMMGVTPLSTKTCLCDARQMACPLLCLNSGKKTDAPVLGGTNLLQDGVSFYYCIYRQNQKADYNYYMLPGLFEKETQTQNALFHEKNPSHSSFGPDFNQ
jgi:hypothetical protein